MLIQVKEVGKRFGKRIILRDVNLTVEEGDLIGVLGKSGSGKTTLLQLLSGFLQPDRGGIFYYNAVHKPKSLRKNLSKIKPKIGYASQQNSFYPKLSILENLLHFGSMYPLTKKTLSENVKALLHQTHLFDHRHALAEHLSGGMQRRLDVALSLVHSPKILFLDEPTADLDPVLRQETLQFLKQVQSLGITIIMASHDVPAVETICNKVAIVHNQGLYTTGLIDEIKVPHHREHFTIRMNPGQNKATLLAALQSAGLPCQDGGQTVTIYPQQAEQTISTLIKLIKDHQLYLSDIELKKPSLHEVFTSLVAQ